MDQKNDDLVSREYRMTGYNIVRCGVCGVPWSDHPRIVFCDRYRPSVDILKSAHPDVINIVTRNLEPDNDTTVKEKSNHAHVMRALRCHPLERFLRAFRLLR
jgi:hypothetical protein